MIFQTDDIVSTILEFLADDDRESLVIVSKRINETVRKCQQSIGIRVGVEGWTATHAALLAKLVLVAHIKLIGLTDASNTLRYMEIEWSLPFPFHYTGTAMEYQVFDLDVLGMEATPLRKHLRSLEIAAIPILCGLEALETFNNLESIRISPFSNVAQSVSEIPKLNIGTFNFIMARASCRTMDAKHIPVWPASMRKIELIACEGGLTTSVRECSTLSSLSLTLPRNVDIGFLASLTGLVDLSLVHSSSIQNLDMLSTCVALQQLNVSHCLELQCVEGLAPCKVLKKVTFYWCNKLSNIDVLANCPLLEEISITATNVTDIRALSRCENLTTIEGYNLDATGLAKHCQKMRDVVCKGPIEGISEICTLPTLTTLVYRGHLPRFPDTPQMVENCVGLKTLMLGTLAKDLTFLVSCTLLVNLKLYCCRNLVSVAPLAALKSLKTVDLNICRSLRNVDGLNGCVKLRKLDLTDCSRLVDIAGLQGLTELEELNIIECRRIRTDEYHMLYFPSLRVLTLRCQIEVFPIRQMGLIRFDGTMDHLCRLFGMSENMAAIREAHVHEETREPTMESRVIKDTFASRARMFMTLIEHLSIGCCFNWEWLKYCTHLVRLELRNENSESPIILSSCRALEQVELSINTSVPLIDLSSCHKLRTAVIVCMCETSTQEILLSKCSRLISLYIRCGTLNRLTGLGDCVKLQKAHFKFWNRDDKLSFAGLQCCTDLFRLTIEAVRSADLQALLPLRSLRYLRISLSGDIQNLNLVGQLTQVRQLVIDGLWNLTDVTGLEHMPQLIRLRLNQCPRVLAIERLRTLPNLRYAELTLVGERRKYPKWKAQLEKYGEGYGCASPVMAATFSELWREIEEESVEIQPSMTFKIRETFRKMFSSLKLRRGQQ